MTDFFDNWTVQVRKGILEMCILTALKDRERKYYSLTDEGRDAITSMDAHLQTLIKGMNTLKRKGT